MPQGVSCCEVRPLRVVFPLLGFRTNRQDQQFMRPAIKSDSGQFTTHRALHHEYARGRQSGLIHFERVLDAPQAIHGRKAITLSREAERHG